MFLEGLQGHSETTEEPWIGTMTPGSQLNINLRSSVPCQQCPQAEQCSCGTAHDALTLCYMLQGFTVLSYPFPLTGTEVASVQAMHMGGSSGHITYSIISGNERNAFLIQPSSGTAPGTLGELCSWLLRCLGAPGHRTTVHNLYSVS